MKTETSTAKQIIVFGDSITEGLSLPVPEQPNMWVRVVEAQSAGRLQMINEGKGGRPTAEIGEFEAMLDRHPCPDVLVLALGGNDARDISDACVPNALNNLRQMIAKARARYGDRLPILLVAPTNIRKESLGPTRPIANEREGKLKELGAAYAELAREQRCDFISHYGIVPDLSLTSDGVHPDSAGHAAIAAVMLPKLLSY